MESFFSPPWVTHQRHLVLVFRSQMAENLPLQPQIQPSVLHLKQPRVPNPSSQSSQSSQSSHTWEPEAEFIPTPSHGNSSSRQNLHYAACNYQYKRNKTIWWNVRKILPLSHPDRQEESPNLYANGQLEAFLGNCKEVMPLCKSEGEKKKRWDRKPRLNSACV